jgi:RimJ/RimL family protein N-acetyltransferase
VGTLIHEALSQPLSEDPPVYGFDWFRHDDPSGSARDMASYLSQAWSEPPVAGKRHDLPFLVTAHDTNLIVGLQTIVVPADFEDTRSVETWSWFAPHARGQRFGVPARQAALEVAFSVVNAHVAVSATRPGNYASAEVSRHTGYTRTGTRLDSCTDFGVTQDVRMNVWEITSDIWTMVRPDGVSLTDGECSF